MLFQVPRQDCGALTTALLHLAVHHVVARVQPRVRTMIRGVNDLELSDFLRNSMS